MIAALVTAGGVVAGGVVGWWAGILLCPSGAMSADAIGWAAGGAAVGGVAGGAVVAGIVG